MEELQDTILKGLDFRIKQINQSISIARDANLTLVLNDFEIRLDEVQSLKDWILKIGENNEIKS